VLHKRKFHFLIDNQSEMNFYWKQKWQRKKLRRKERESIQVKCKLKVKAFILRPWELHKILNWSKQVEIWNLFFTTQLNSKCISCYFMFCFEMNLNLHIYNSQLINYFNCTASLNFFFSVYFISYTRWSINSTHTWLNFISFWFLSF